MFIAVICREASFSYNSITRDPTGENAVICREASFSYNYQQQ